MRNTNRPQKMRKQPGKLTQWAYFMQAIEPKSEAINKAFPGYHPQWVQQSQKMTIGPENFMLLRLMLGMSQKQCAAFLRAGESTVRKWESGDSPVPFAEFELLRLILESVSFRTSHPEWDGWFISKDGKLVSPNGGRCGYTPDDLNMITLTIAEKSRLSSEVNKLQAAFDSAVAENTRLRQMFLSQGVVDELTAMQDRLSSLVASIATARVIPFRMADIEQQKEKVA